MQKVLILRFSSIGDIVLTTPVIRAIKQQKPNTEIHYATKKSYANVLEHNPYIDQLHLLKDSTGKLIKELKEHKFDLIIDLHHNLRTSRIKFHLRKPSVTFSKLNIEKWLMVQFNINKLPQIHIVDRYFDPIHHWGIKNDHKGLEYYNGCEDHLDIPELEEVYHAKYAALVIGGTYYTKQIPEEKLYELIEQIKLPVVILGGPGEIDLAEKIHQKYPKKCWNAVGKSNLNQSAELIRKSDFVITGDTGLMHIAAAYQKKIYSFWGNTIPEFGMTPYMPQNPEKSIILEVNDLNCRPCSKLGYYHCPKKHFNCMMKQDLNLVK
jgi:ADP-heptose:LPS heptosyltransferase